MVSSQICTSSAPFLRFSLSPLHIPPVSGLPSCPPSPVVRPLRLRHVRATRQFRGGMSPFLRPRQPFAIDCAPPSFTFEQQGWSASGALPTSPQPPIPSPGCGEPEDPTRPIVSAPRSPVPRRRSPFSEEGALDGISADSRFVGIGVFCFRASCWSRGSDGRVWGGCSRIKVHGSYRKEHPEATLSSSCNST